MQAVIDSTEQGTIVHPVTLRAIMIEQLELEAMINNAYDELELPADATDEQRAECAERRANMEDALYEFLKSNEDSANSKIEGYVGLIKSIENRGAERKAEAERMRKLADGDTNKAKALKAQLQYYMEETKRRKIETKLYKLSVCANGGRLSMIVDKKYEEEPKLLPALYQKTVVVIDDALLRPAAEAYKADLDKRDAALKAFDGVDPASPEYVELEAQLRDLQAKVEGHACHGIATMADRGKHLRIG